MSQRAGLMVKSEFSAWPKWLFSPWELTRNPVEAPRFYGCFHLQTLLRVAWILCRERTTERKLCVTLSRNVHVIKP